MMGFKEYLKNVPYLRLPEDISSSKGEEHEEVPEDKDTVIMAQQVGKGKSDILEEDFDDTPPMRLGTRKRKVRLDDSSDLVPSTATIGDVPSSPTGNASRVTDYFVTLSSTFTSSFRGYDYCCLSPP